MEGQKSYGNCITKHKIPKEVFNFEYCHNCKQLRIRKLVLIYGMQSNPHELCIIHVSSVS